jgi:hypothetical protein
MFLHNIIQIEGFQKYICSIIYYLNLGFLKYTIYLSLVYMIYKWKVNLFKLYQFFKTMNGY